MKNHVEEPVDAESCTKYGYTKGAAKRALGQIRARRSRKRGKKMEVSAYECRFCGKWHLSSSEDEY